MCGKMDTANESEYVICSAVSVSFSDQ